MGRFGQNSLCCLVHPNFIAAILSSSSFNHCIMLNVFFRESSCLRFRFLLLSVTRLKLDGNAMLLGCLVHPPSEIDGKDALLTSERSVFVELYCCCLGPCHLAVIEMANGNGNSQSFSPLSD